MLLLLPLQAALSRPCALLFLSPLPGLAIAFAMSADRMAPPPHQGLWLEGGLIPYSEKGANPSCDPGQPVGFLSLEAPSRFVITPAHSLLLAATRNGRRHASWLGLGLYWPSQRVW